jgi:hypothetical protein
VLAVTDGRPTKQSLVVTRFKRTENGTLKILAGSGSIVIASAENGKRVFSLNGTGVDSIEQGALELVTDLEAPAPNDDLMFGTHDRKKIGDSWPINANLMIRTLNQNSSQKINSLKGKATLKDVVQEAGGPALIVDVDIIAVPGFPPGVVVDQASATVKLSAHFPVDTALGKPEESTDMKMSCHLRIPEKNSEINSHGTQSVTLKRTPLH